MVWPAVAVRAVTCSLRPKDPQVHEDDPCELQFSIRNWLPMPLWGLSVEGFLDRSCEQVDTDKIPTVALAFVRGLTTSTYRFSIQPDFRGCYPDGDATLTCSFPFGIWTAKRKLEDITPITVWPKVYPITGQAVLKGRNTAELGEGERSGRAGNFIGIRDYRNGDSLRDVNWIATARYGELVVTERSAPQSCNVEVIVDVGAFEEREQLAKRIRVAASVLANLHHSSISLTVRIGKQVIHVMPGAQWICTDDGCSPRCRPRDWGNHKREPLAPTGYPSPFLRIRMATSLSAQQTPMQTDGCLNSTCIK